MKVTITIASDGTITIKPIPLASFYGDGSERMTSDDLAKCFNKVQELPACTLVEKLCKITGRTEATCWRAIGEQGYLRQFLMRKSNGKIQLKEAA